jgi:hypothetical protein
MKTLTNLATFDPMLEDHWQGDSTSQCYDNLFCVPQKFIDTAVHATNRVYRNEMRLCH